MNEIIPGLFIGDFNASIDLSSLVAARITHIVSAIRQKPVSHPTLTVHQVPIDDVESTDIISHFESTNAFISNVLLIKKERVLVHCVAGVSRSTTLVAAYLMTLKSGIAAEKVVRFIKSKREQAEPSSSFMSQLEIWERTGCEWNPAKWSEQRRFLMDNMAAQVRDGASPATVLANYPSASLITSSAADVATPVSDSGSSKESADSSDPISTKDEAPSPSIEGSIMADPRRIRCKMCRRELAARSHILDHEQGMGQHAFAPRRRDITVYRAEQERHRADEQAKDRLEIQERLASEAAAGIVQITPFKSTATPITTGAPKPTMATSISVPVPVVAPPPIIKLSTTVAGLRISMPMTHGVTRAPVGRPSRPLPTPANTGSAAPPILSPSIPLAARTVIIPSSQVPQAVTAPSALTLPLPVEAPLLPSHLCSSYYVEPLGWMNDILETGILAGKIVCPNSKCSAKLGSFDWAGLQCSCGAWVSPGFALNVSKVDEIISSTAPILRQL